MKKLLLFLSLLTTSLHAARLEWDASPTPTVIEYWVYDNSVASTVGSTKIGTTPSSVLTFPLPPLDGLPHYYHVTAWTGFLESDPSNMVAGPLRPAPVTDLRMNP